MRNFFTRSFIGTIRGNFCRIVGPGRACGWEYCKRNVSNTTFYKMYGSLSTFEFSLDNPQISNYIEKLVEEYQSLALAQMGIGGNTENDVNAFSRFNELRPIIAVFHARQELHSNLSSLEEMSRSSDKELATLAEEERELYQEKLESLESELLSLLVPRDQEDSFKDVMLEISAGVGGQEAMLFAKELHDMYIAYADFKAWDIVVAEEAFSDLGGLRHSSLFIYGEDVFRHLKYEAGVHRVQRIPSTEKSGRVHTSTVSVTILPQPEEVEVELKDKDLKIETKRSSGAGGQHVNTTDSAVRMTHIPTGITVECQVDRSQIKNRKIALQRLRTKLYQQQLDEQLEQAKATRKQQVKSNLRSEKIRTYNFNQDRITDHRVSDNMYNMESFLSGGHLLDRLIGQLELNSSKERLQQKILESVDP